MSEFTAPERDGASDRARFELLRIEESRGVSLAKLPGRHQHHRHVGYVYILQTGGGMTKIGRSSNPFERITTHARNAAPHGSVIVRLWLSIAHLDSAKVEKELIRQARQSSSGMVRNEYFTGLNFGALADTASRAPYRPIDLGVIADLESREIAPFGRVETPSEGTGDFVEGARACISGLLGRQTDGTYRLPVTFGGSSSDELETVFIAVARARGCSTAEVRDMTRLDLLREMVTSIVHTEVLELQAYAQRTGHWEVLETLGDALTQAQLIESLGSSDLP